MIPRGEGTVATPDRKDSTPLAVPVHQSTTQSTGDGVLEVLGRIPQCMRERGVEPPEHTGRGWATAYLETAEHAQGMVLMECVRAANKEIGSPPNVLLLP